MFERKLVIMNLISENKVNNNYMAANTSQVVLDENLFYFTRITIYIVVRQVLVKWIMLFFFLNFLKFFLIKQIHC